MNRKNIQALLFVMRLQYKSAKRYLVWAVFYAVYDGLSSIASVYAGAKFLSGVTAVATHKPVTHTTYMWLGVILVLEIVDIAARTINRTVERRIQYKTELTLNEMLMTKMYELNQEQYDDQAYNTKLARARDALSSLWHLTSQVSWGVSSVVRFVSAMSAIIVVAPLVGLVITFMVVPITIIRTKQNKFNESINKKVEPIDRVAFRTRWIMIDPVSMPEVRLMNAFKHLVQTWREHTLKSQKIVIEADNKMIPVDVFADAVEPFISFGATLYFLRLLVQGVFGLDRFIFLRGLLEQASSAATSIVNSVQQLHETSIDMKNFNEVWYMAPAIPNGTVQVSAPLTIEFKNVSFAYPRAEKDTLKDISFVIFPGSKLALVGENGAGKSTLIKLLLRQYLPTSGTITVNGVNIKDVEQESYYQAISNLSQDFLMVNHLTIKDNLTLGLTQDVTQPQIEDTAKLVGADSFITKLKHGYDQRLDPSFDDGTGLSGGQMQRIGVARALLRNGDMIILDEPTSAIDAKAEYMIFNNIYKHHGDRTTLIVSHRFSTVRKADKIIVMENGKITEYGSHEDLLKHKGLYKEMFEAQAEGYK